MAPSWPDYYVANEADGGHLHVLCEKDHSKVADLTKGLLGDSNKFARTLNSSGGANVIMIPSPGTPMRCIFFIGECLPVHTWGGGRYSGLHTETSVNLLQGPGCQRSRESYLPCLRDQKPRHRQGLPQAQLPILCHQWNSVEGTARRGRPNPRGTPSPPLGPPNNFLGPGVPTNGLGQPPSRIPDQLHSSCQVQAPKLHR
jgi:hypothetical protein